MGSVPQLAEWAPVFPPGCPGTKPADWYAIQTRPRHEKKAAAELQNKGVVTFLPLYTEIHRWSDRRKLVEMPLFPCYAFIHMVPSDEVTLRVLRTTGVLGFVGIRGQGLPIPDNQIEDVRKLLACRVPFSPYPFLRAGQRVRIRGGSLDGIEGVLVARKGDRSFIISVELIQRSLAIRIEGFDVEAL